MNSFISQLIHPHYPLVLQLVHLIKLMSPLLIMTVSLYYTAVYCHNYFFYFFAIAFAGVSIMFTHGRFFGSETEAAILVSVEIVEGLVSISFDVTITPSEQSPVSAEGNTLLTLCIGCYI